ncbi:hypothetical protein [Mesonia sp.]|uniref:hypothetical protein n=1 Tax=Mesonia sp. TaxID=1960830 RepID=UPI0025B9A267|nr:hypothetical protein [Mesonia sp.]
MKKIALLQTTALILMIASFIMLILKVYPGLIFGSQCLVILIQQEIIKTLRDEK